MHFKKIISIIILFYLISIPKLSYADDFTESNELDTNLYINTSSDLTGIPTINARHAIVLDRCSKTTLFGKNENEKCKMASTTKIMTAIVVLENCPNLDEIVTISKKSAGTGGSRLGLSTNDTITVENLLYGLLLVSGNDTAVALAEYIGGSIENFCEMMNKKALELGLTNTNFVTPHGLDSDDHYTTAYELAIITDYALKNPTFSKIVNTSNYSVTISGKIKNLHNTNELLGNLNGIYGVKTGFTNGANRCLVTSCKRGDLDIICVVLGCDTKKDRTLDSINLINYIFQNFSTINLYEIIKTNFNIWKQNNINSFTINKGIGCNLDLFYKEEDLPYNSIAINNNIKNKISTPITFKSYYNAPLAQNSVIGQINLLIDNKSYFSINILNKNTINKKSTGYYFKDFIKNYLTYSYIL